MNDIDDDTEMMDFVVTPDYAINSDDDEWCIISNNSFREAFNDLSMEDSTQTPECINSSANWNAPEEKTRNILVFPGVVKRGRSRQNPKDFSIDEDDYNVINEIMSMMGIEGDDKEKLLWHIADTDAVEGRVMKLRLTPVSIQMPSIKMEHIRSLPSSIGRLESLEELDLRDAANLSCLPEDVGDQLSSLRKLVLSGSAVRSLPASIGQLQKLQELELSRTFKLINFPDELWGLRGLTNLDLSDSKIMSLPETIGRLQNLKELNLGNCEYLFTLPDEIGDLGSLTVLNLNNSPIASLPSKIGRLENLQELYLGGAKNLVDLPDKIVLLRKLQKLYLGGAESLSKLPDEIGNLASLTTLIVTHSRIKVLPSSIGKLQNLRLLDLANNTDLADLCEEIGDLTSLRLLSLSHSAISSLPPSIQRRCHSIRYRAGLGGIMYIT